jgi:hypothetical protein
MGPYRSGFSVSSLTEIFVFFTEYGVLRTVRMLQLDT